MNPKKKRVQMNDIDNEPDLHLSGKEALVLDLLLSRGNREKYGLEMVTESRGGLKRGTIYVTLGRMEEARLVESHEEPTPEGETGPRRRLYRATGDGERAWQARNAWRTALGLKPSLA